MVIEVGEDFEENFDRELENYTIYRSHADRNSRDRSTSTHFRWSELVEFVGLPRVFYGRPPSFVFV